MIKHPLLRKYILEGAGGGKAADTGRVAQEAPNTLRSSAVAKFIDLLSEGEIGGLVDAEKSVFFNKVPAHNEDDTPNFSGFSYATRNGLADQPHIDGFDQVTAEYSVALRVRKDQAAEWVSNSAVLDGVIVTVQIPALTKQDKTNGDMNGFHVALAIDVKNLSLGGDWVEKVGYDYIQGKNTAPYERSYKIMLSTPGQYAIRVRRISDDNDNDVSIQDKLYFQRVTEVIDQKVTYADSAVVGISINSEQFGTSIPQRQYEIYGMKCRYPSNYNPLTRTYTGFWDGTWSYGWCNNPAWVFMAMATHPRYGAGISDQFIDKWGLYELARYSDELVPDGAGGTEPRFVFNGSIASREEAYRVLQGIASMMRAIVFYAAGAAIVRQDKEFRTEELKSFTKANVDGDFNYSTTGKKARHTAANVQWVNPALGYEKDFVFYEDRPAIIKYGFNVLNIAAYGTTSRGQAYRLAKWTVLTDLLQTETVQFVAGYDACDVLPGDVIEVADPHWATADFGGRIAEISADGSKVTLDRAIDFTGATSPEIHLTLMSGPVDDVTNVGGPAQDRPVKREMRHFSSPVAAWDAVTNTVTLSNPVPLSQVSNLYTPLIWVFSKDQLEPRLFKVFDVEERANAKGTQFKISAINYSPEKFDEVDLGETIQIEGENPYTDLPNIDRCQPPANLTGIYESAFSGGSTVAGINLSWDVSPDRYLQSYELSYRRNLDNWTDVSGIVSNNYSLERLPPGRYEFVLRAVNRFGVRSAPLTAEVAELESASNKDLIYDITSDNGTAVFSGRDCTVKWESRPISHVANQAPATTRVVRPGVGDVNIATYGGTETAPSITYSTTAVGDQIELNIGRDQFYVQRAVGQTQIQAIEALKAAIDAHPDYTASRTSSTINIGFTGASQATKLSADGDPIFRRYIVEVRNADTNALIRTDYTLNRQYVYSYDMNVADNVTPKRSLKFKIYVQDGRDNISNGLEQIISNPPPTLTAPTVFPATDGFRLEFAQPTDQDFAGINVWTSLGAGVSTTLPNRKWHSLGNPFIPGSPGVTYYYKYAFYDAFSESDVTISAEATVTLPMITADYFDTTPPGVPTGLTVTSSLALDNTGQQIVRLRATWTAPGDSDLNGYELAITQSGGNEIVFPIPNVTAYEVVVPGNVSHAVKIRSIDKLGNRSAYTSVVNHTTAADSSAPSAPTSVNVTAGIRGAFLTWANDSAADLDRVEVWQNSINNTVGATRIAVVNATPSRSGGFSVTGLTTGTPVYFWLKSVDTSGNASAFTSSVTTTPVAVTNTDVVVGTLSGDRIVAGSLEGDRFSTTTSLPGTITVGLTGVTIATIETRASDPAARVNAQSTLIDPGRILISGATTLGNWRNGTDQTKIEGGAIYANTVSANALVIGSRGITITGIELEHNKPGTDQVSWGAGTIGYINDAGAAVSASITAGNATWTTGILYVYWVKGATTLSTTTNSGTARHPDNVIIATYTGGILLVANYGRTIVDGSTIKADTIGATRLKANAIQTYHLDARVVTASKLQISSGENLLLNGDFKGGTLDGWSRSVIPSGSSIVVASNTISSWPSNTAMLLTRGGTGGELSIVADNLAFDAVDAYKSGIPTQLNDEFLFEATEYHSVSQAAVIELVWRRNDGTINVINATVGANTSLVGTTALKFSGPTSTFNKVTGIFKNNLGDGRLFLRVSENGGASGAYVYLWNVLLRRRAAGSLIVDGSITSINIGADQIQTNHMAANSINGDRVTTNTLDANKIKASNIEVSVGVGTTGKIVLDGVNNRIVISD